MILALEKIILGKLSIAKSANTSIINGQRLHKSIDIVGEKKVIWHNFQNFYKNFCTDISGKRTWVLNSTMNFKIKIYFLFFLRRKLSCDSQIDQRFHYKSLWYLLIDVCLYPKNLIKGFIKFAQPRNKK